LLHNHHHQPLVTKEACPDKASPTLPHQRLPRVCISLEKKNFKARIFSSRRRNGAIVKAAKAEQMDSEVERLKGERMVAEEAAREKRAEKTE
jgi:hypothetical protein